jgi:hypothetical protein
MTTREVWIQVMWMWPMETDSRKSNKWCHGEGPRSKPANFFRGRMKNGVMKDHRGPWRPYGDVMEGGNGCSNEECAADNAVNATATADRWQGAVGLHMQEGNSTLWRRASFQVGRGGLCVELTHVRKQKVRGDWLQTRQGEQPIGNSGRLERGGR